MSQKTERKRKQFSLSVVVRVFLVMLVVISVVIFAAGVMRYNELMRTERSLEAEKESLQAEKEELTELQNAEQDEDYFVRVARKIWRLFYPDEEIIYNDLND